MKRSLTFPVQVTRDIKEDTTHSSVVFSFCVAVGSLCSNDTKDYLMKGSLTFPVQVTRDIKEDTTHSSVVFSFCVAVGSLCSNDTKD